MSDDKDDFYEEDEPVEKIKAIFERGEKVFTAEPQRGVVLSTWDPASVVVSEWHLTVELSGTTAAISLPSPSSVTIK